MRLERFSGVGIVLALAFLPLFPAARAGEAEHVMLVGGHRLIAEVVEVTDAGIRVLPRGASGKNTITIDREDLDACYYYRKRDAAIGDEDAESRIRLATWALEQGLVDRARRQLRLAQMVDPDVYAKSGAEIAPRVREGAARKALATVRRHLERGDLVHAGRIAAGLLTELPRTEAAEVARKLVETIQDALLEREADQVAKRLKRLEEKERADELAAERKRQSILEPIAKRINNARKANIRALQNHHTGQAKTGFQEAASVAAKVVKAVEQRLAASSDDALLEVALKELRARAEQETVEAHVNAGTVLLVGGDFEGAAAQADQALAVAPANARALAFRARVETAAAERERFARG